MFDMSFSSTQRLQQQRQNNQIKVDNILEKQQQQQAKHEKVTELRSVIGQSSALEQKKLEDDQGQQKQPQQQQSTGKIPLTTLSSTDPATQDLIEGMKKITMPTLVLGIQTDLLFPVWQQKEIAECLRASGNKKVTYYELDAMFGHDTFLIDRVSVGGAIKGHLETKI